MKNLKKILALALAVILTLSLCTVAFADTTAPLADKTHTYTAYQIFSGTQTDEEGDATLGAVEWGNGIDYANFLTALQESDAFDGAFDECVEAADVAEAMKDWSDGSDEAMAFAKLAENYIVTANGISCENNITTLDAGYYLVVDTTEEVDADDAYNIALLQLTKKDIFAIAAKNSVPEVEKKVNNGLICEVTAEDHVHTKACYDWEDANNAAIGDTVNFKIESAVPETATEYEYYFFIVNDTLSDGLDFANPLNLKVYIGDAEATTADYTVKTNGRNLQIALVDAIENAGKSVVVTYDAVVNTSAIIGVEGNQNKVTVDFSNNPNEDFDGTPDDENYPGFPNDEDYTPGGKTPEDYTLTYVSKINVYKVDENKAPLTGAEFTLSGETLNQVLVMTEKFTKVEEGGTYYKLNDNTYTTEAPIAEDYMKAAEEGATAGYVIDNEYTGDDKIIYGEDIYRAYVPATDGNMPIYILVKANADKYASATDMYKLEWVSTTKTASGDTLNVVGAVDEYGVVSFAGLPAGTYTLSETVVPNGYNPIPDITFTTTWTAPENGVTDGTEECKWDVATGDTSGVAYNAAADAFEITIKNEKGSTLPETGGIGTTIFYVLGSVLLVGAAILLITKKRMSAEG